MIARIFGGLAILLGVTAILLIVLRVSYEYEIARLWDALREPAASTVFDPQSVAELPEPARRFFLHAITPGTLGSIRRPQDDGRNRTEAGCRQAAVRGTPGSLDAGAYWEGVGQQGADEDLG